MLAQSPGEQATELERLKNGRHDLLRALNDLRARLAVELSDQDRMQRKLEPVARPAPCAESVVRTSGADKPGLAQGNQAPESFYPAASRRTEFEGKVTIEAWVSANGCMQKAEVYTSSGVADLDDAAMRWTQQAKFLPAERDHQPVDGSLLFMIRFQLSVDP
jgi:TonB family protein